jgi:molybdopterin-containing oxidoreductase family iron-sulfur binding subunit
VTPGIAPNIVAMPVGQGHTSYTRYASGRGANPVEILAPVNEPSTGALAWGATRVKVTRVGEPDGRLVLFSSRNELRLEPHAEQVR